MRSTKIRRLARFAETSFATLCASAGALCHQAQEDENGWDFLVEFPVEMVAGPADTQPPGNRAFVQIKSTKTDRISCSIKLSNALKAAQSRDPWFVVMMVEDNGAPKIYSVHIWKDQIERSLRAVRKAFIDNAPLHKRTIETTFSECDLHICDLIDWMQSTIRSIGPEYSNTKSAIYNTVGYEDGCGIGKLTFIADSKEQIFDEFLGLGAGLPVNRFTYTPARFGLTGGNPQIVIEEGRVEITPTPAGGCELRMRGSTPSAAIGLPAKLFTLGMPWLPFEEQRFRVSATGFEAVWSKNADSRFTASLDLSARVPLVEIHRYATVVTWLSRGPVDVQIWAKGCRIVSGVLSHSSGRQHYDWEKILNVVAMLQSLHGNLDEEALRVSVIDIDTGAKDLYLMHEVTSSNNLQLEFLPIPGQSYDFSAVLYYSTATVGDATAYALVERRVQHWSDSAGGRCRVVFGPPLLREGWLISNLSDPQRRMIHEDYQHHLRDMEKDTTVLELNDIATFIRSQRDTLAIGSTTLDTSSAEEGSVSKG